MWKSKVINSEAKSFFNQCLFDLIKVRKKIGFSYMNAYI